MTYKQRLIIFSFQLSLDEYNQELLLAMLKWVYNTVELKFLENTMEFEFDFQENMFHVGGVRVLVFSCL